MTRSRSRLALILAPVLVTVLIAAVLGTFIVVQSQQQSDRIEEADGAAADYLSSVAIFRAGVTSAVKKADQDSPAAIRKALLTATATPPTLADADPFGMDNSAAYARAEQVRADLLQPYEDLSTQLKAASVSLTYIRAARKALALRITDYLGSTTVSNSVEVRSRLIPAFVAARDDLDAVTVPKGQKKLAATVVGAIQYVIDQSTILAGNIDANRNYSFTYSAQFEAAMTAVEDYSTQVTGDLTEALNGLGDLGS